MLLLGVVATATAAVVVVNNLAQGHEGVENPGQPLAGAEMECMTPPQAAAFLAAHGYTDVVWQVETGNVFVKGAERTVLQSTPPEHGYVVPASIIDGRLQMIVDQRVGVHGVGRCYGMPMP